MAWSSSTHDVHTQLCDPSVSTRTPLEGRVRARLHIPQQVHNHRQERHELTMMAVWRFQMHCTRLPECPRGGSGVAIFDTLQPCGRSKEPVDDSNSVKTEMDEAIGSVVGWEVGSRARDGEWRRRIAVGFDDNGRHVSQNMYDILIWLSSRWFAVRGEASRKVEHARRVTLKLKSNATNTTWKHPVQHQNVSKGQYRSDLPPISRWVSYI